MREGTYRVVLASVVLGSMAPALASAETITRANRQDISMLLDAATGMNSAYRASFIGETQDRIYVEYVTGIHASSIFSNRPRRVVYWAPRSEITEETLTRFKAYKDRETRDSQRRQAPGK